MGIKVRTNRHGYLFLRIFWKGRDVWVGVKERDDGPRGEKRTLLEAKARLIKEELRKGTPLHLALINVLGDCPPALVPTQERVKPGEDVTVGEAAEEWYRSLKSNRRRKSLLEKTRYYNGVEQLVLRHHPIAMADQVEEHVEVELAPMPVR